MVSAQLGSYLWTANQHSAIRKHGRVPDLHPRFNAMTAKAYFTVEMAEFAVPCEVSSRAEEGTFP